MNSPVFVVGVSGPPGSGKSTLIASMQSAMSGRMQVAHFEVDPYPVPGTHSPYRFDVIAAACLAARTQSAPLVFVETTSALEFPWANNQVDRSITVLDVAGGGRLAQRPVPLWRLADILVWNKIDLAPFVDADLAQMEQESQRLREGGGVVLAQANEDVGVGDVLALVLLAQRMSSHE